MAAPDGSSSDDTQAARNKSQSGQKTDHVLPLSPGKPKLRMQIRGMASITSGKCNNSPMFSPGAPSQGTNSNVETKNQTISDQYTLPPREPPVTKETLSELDVPKIIFNPKLRHDVNFDPDLHFRPNIDGKRGQEKNKQASDFWKVLELQLNVFSIDEANVQLGGERWCLTELLQAIGEILATLVPPEDCAEVEDNLNVDLLMQQFYMGVADIQKLAQWLSLTLKSHCAPMRDHMVDSMEQDLINGYAHNDVSLLVNGLRNLLGVLEAMKLDVANHQIRCLRPLLIQDTVEFEQRFFLKRIENKRVNVEGARSWFQNAVAAQTRRQGWTVGTVQTLVEGFVRFILPATMRYQPPDTFAFDEERISKLRMDLWDIINMEICMHLYRDLIDRVHRQPCQNQASSRGLQGLSPTWRNGLESSSPASRSTPAMDQNIATTKNFIPFYAYSESKSKNDERLLRQSLLAILASYSDAVRQDLMTRWKQSAPSLALEILRSSGGPLSWLSTFELELSLYLNNPSSSLFHTVEEDVADVLLTLLEEIVPKWTKMTTGGMFEAGPGAKAARPVRKSSFEGVQSRGRAAGGARIDMSFIVAAGSNPSHKSALHAELLESAKQIAHICILHWRVWAPLVYEQPDSEAMDVKEDLSLVSGENGGETAPLGSGIQTQNGKTSSIEDGARGDVGARIAAKG